MKERVLVRMYMFCIHTDHIPPKLRLGNTLPPGPGGLTDDDRDYLEDYFFENRDRIVAKLNGEIEKSL